MRTRPCSVCGELYRYGWSNKTRCQNCLERNDIAKDGTRVYVPDEATIAEECAKFRAGWSKEEERSRRMFGRLPLIPVVRLIRSTKRGE